MFQLRAIDTLGAVVRLVMQRLYDWMWHDVHDGVGVLLLWGYGVRRDGYVV
jgi:hypothetical protein